MREEPPQELVRLLERLDLAAPDRVRSMGRRMHRLARGLPLFDSVWVDALARARVITHFQAGEIAAGRGDALRVGPYVLWRRLPSPGYVDCYLARETGTREMARLAVIHPPNGRFSTLARRLETLAAESKRLDSPVLAPITQVGTDGDRVWAASRHVPGRTAADWLVRGGRFPPQLVLKIARQMLTGLRLLEEAGLCHGDIGAAKLILTDGGDVVLPHPGLRRAVIPEEEFSQPELEPEEYDYLAPERVAEGTPPSTAGDIYACGCLWWHLLTGRPPVPGGGSLVKLRAVGNVRIPDVSKLAPGTPDSLAAAIRASVERAPASRPESMTRLAEMLGPPTRVGKLTLGRCLRRPQWTQVPGYGWPHAAREAKLSVSWPATAAGCLVAAVVIGLCLWRFGLSTFASAAGTPMASPKPAEATAAAIQPEGDQNVSAPDAEPARESRIDDLVLPGGSPLPIESLELRPGQCVRGEPDRRPLVVVPQAGWVVRPEGLRFENIDFVWDDAAAPAPSSETPAAILHVTAARAEFRGCSFQPAGTATRAPVAVRWTHPADRDRAELALFSGQLQLSDCVLRNVRVGVACETLGALAVEMANVLSLDTGPLVELDHCPAPDEPVLIGLANVTLRNAGPVLECRYREIPDQPGTISVQASGCALATQPDAGLLSFVGPSRPERILSKIRWSGQGSLVLPDARIAVWRPPQSDTQVLLDDALVSIAGLVRSEVEFSGPAQIGPDSSRIVRWQVPLRSSDPPGIDPQTLAWPDRL